MKNFIQLETGHGNTLISVDSIASVSKDDHGEETMIILKATRKPYEYETGFNQVFYTKQTVEYVLALMKDATAEVE